MLIDELYLEFGKLTVQFEILQTRISQVKQKIAEELQKQRGKENAVQKEEK